MNKVLILLVVFLVLISGCSSNNDSSKSSKLIQDLENSLKEGDFVKYKILLGEVENDNEFMKYSKLLFDNTLTSENALSYVEDIEKSESSISIELKNELIKYIDDQLDLKYPKETIFSNNQMIYLNEFVSSFIYPLENKDYSKQVIEGALNDFIDRLYYKVGLTDFGYSRNNLTIDLEIAQKILSDGMSIEDYTDFVMKNNVVDVSNMYSGGPIISAYLVETDVKPSTTLLTFHLVTMGYGVSKVENIVIGSIIDNQSFMGVKISEFISRNNDYSSLNFEKSEATSELQEGNIVHSIKNINDGNLNTAWVEGVADQGVNEELTFSSANEQEVTGLLISNGYMKSESHYFKNSRVKTLQITFDNNIVKFYELYDYHFYPEDEFYSDFISFGEVIKTKTIKIRILETYNGSAFKDTCISEIKFIR